MGIEYKAVISSSVDGKELPEDTTPYVLVLDDKEFELWLSDKQREELERTVAKFHAHENSKRFVRGTGGATKKRQQHQEAVSLWLNRMQITRQDAIDWYEQNKSELPDHISIGDRGRISDDFRAAFEAANS